MIFSLEKATFPISFVKKAVEHEFLSAFCSFVVVISLRISPNAPNDMYSTKFYLVFVNTGRYYVRHGQTPPNLITRNLQYSMHSWMAHICPSMMKIGKISPLEMRVAITMTLRMMPVKQTFGFASCFWWVKLETAPSRSRLFTRGKRTMIWYKRASMIHTII